MVWTVTMIVVGTAAGYILGHIWPISALQKKANKNG